MFLFIIVLKLKVFVNLEYVPEKLTLSSLSHHHKAATSFLIKWCHSVEIASILLKCIFDQEALVGIIIMVRLKIVKFNDNAWS